MLKYEAGFMRQARLIVGSSEHLGWMGKVCLGWVQRLLMPRGGVLVEGWEQEPVIRVKEAVD